MSLKNLTTLLNVFSQLNKLKKDYFFRDAVYLASGHSVTDFNKKDLALLNQLDCFINNHIQEISDDVSTNFSGRPNELGNYVEKILSERLNESKNICCEMPYIQNKKRQKAGYPDLLIFDTKKMPSRIYADIKVFQAGSDKGTLRSFYYSPTGKNKIQFSAPHIIICFEARAINGAKNIHPFEITNFKIINLHAFKVRIKLEFFANYKDIFLHHQKNVSNFTNNN